MRIEQRLARLTKTIRALLKCRDKRNDRGRALFDARVIIDWLSSSRKKIAMDSWRPSSLERALSNLSTEIFKKRLPRSSRRLFVRLVPMRQSLGRTFLPNLILLHPELCGQPYDLAVALCHEIAHFTRGFMHAHDGVFKLEMEHLIGRHGGAILKAIRSSLNGLTAPFSARGRLLNQ